MIDRLGGLRNNAETRARRQVGQLARIIKDKEFREIFGQPAHFDMIAFADDDRMIARGDKFVDRPMGKMDEWTGGFENGMAAGFHLCDALFGRAVSGDEDGLAVDLVGLLRNLDAAQFQIGENGFVDTGYACRLDRTAATLALDGPPAGVVSVGGYRFVLKELQDFVARAADGSTLAALPDGLCGHRLAGVAADRSGVRQTLAAQGVNPLIVGAFRERRGDRASAA